MSYLLAIRYLLKSLESSITPALSSISATLSESIPVDIIMVTVSPPVVKDELPEDAALEAVFDEEFVEFADVLEAEVDAAPEAAVEVAVDDAAVEAAVLDAMVEAAALDAALDSVVVEAALEDSSAADEASAEDG